MQSATHDELNGPIGRKKNLSVQGWVGINHSYAMVNQYQLLAMLQEPNVQLAHRQMPLFDSRWSQAKNDSGFIETEQAALAAIPEWTDQTPDAVYRIHSPCAVGTSIHREITFMVTELGLDARNFGPNMDIATYVEQGNLIVTPSRWSRDRIIEYGFPASSVYVVPHGVDPAKFKPLLPDERRRARESLGYRDDDVVFLNVGAPIWNKGMDIILQAFFNLRQTHKNARLLIKDQQSLYGLSAVEMIRNLAERGVITIDNDSVESIRVLPNTISLAQLSSLYNVADCYLSPYRAEGFNLPVIEAIACGTPVIVTEGGATDDFCNDYVGQKVPGRKVTNSVINDTKIGAYIDPDRDELLQRMQHVAENGSGRDGRAFAFGRTTLLQQFSWGRAAKELIALI